MILGLIAGLYLKDHAAPLEYLGTLFLNLIKMITIPIIFFTIIYGITNLENQEGLLKISRKAIFIFMSTAVLAVLIGFAVAHLLNPGVGVSVSLLKNAITQPSMSPLPTLTGKEVLMNIIPSNIFAAFVNNNIIQVLFFAFFVGCVLNVKRDSCKDVIAITHQITSLLFEMMRYIMYVAPIGVFGYIGAMVGIEGVSVLITLSKLIFAILFACVIQYIMFGILIICFTRMSPIPFYKKMLTAQLIAFSTSSSKATLVHLMRVAEVDLGVSSKSSRFVLPLSAALNMDGGALYQSICAIFFSQVMGLELHFIDYLTLVVMCTLASIGGAGIPGGVLLFLGMVLQSIGLPVEGVLVIASIDRILDMATTTINITGDACATVLIDHSEGKLNKSVYYAESSLQ